MSDRRLPPPAPTRAKSAQEALEEARLAEAARKEAQVQAQQKRDLAQKLAEEARARFLEERARKEADEQRQRAQRAAEEQRRRAEAARKAAMREEEEDRESEEQAARDRAMATGPVRSGAPKAAPAKTGAHEAPILEGRVRAILARLADDLEIVEIYSDIRPEILAVLWQAHVKRARIEHDLPTLALALALATRFDTRAQAMIAARVLWGGEEWAVWLDTERKEVLAALTPADRYLTGL